MTGPSHLSNYEAALWWMNTADQIINDTGGEELPAAAVASHSALIRASVYSSLAIADAITSHTNDTHTRPADKPTGACPAYQTIHVTSDLSYPAHCQYADGHTGAHRDTNGAAWNTDLTGTRWTTDTPAPQHDGQCDTTEGTRRCLFTTGHPGEHAYRTRHADRCAGNTPGLDNCALDTGHTPPCTDWNGHHIP